MGGWQLGLGLPSWWPPPSSSSTPPSPSTPHRENYLFVCSCPKCLAEADEPNVTSEEDDDEEEEEDAELGDEMTDV